jgi:hypothetical protein
LNWSCGGINKYPAMKICQNMWEWWKLPTVLELGNLCYDSTSCSKARTAISLVAYSQYWSSTEYNNYYARMLYMGDGNVAIYVKDIEIPYVVCVHD